MRECGDKCETAGCTYECDQPFKHASRHEHVVPGAALRGEEPTHKWGEEREVAKPVSRLPTPRQRLVAMRKAVKPATRAGAPTVDELHVRSTRATDPQTSWDAAMTTWSELRETQQAVLALFDCPMTDEEMIARAQSAGVKQSTSGLRTRRSELVDLGFLHDSGERGLTQNNRTSIKWARVSEQA